VSWEPQDAKYNININSKYKKNNNANSFILKGHTREIERSNLNESENKKMICEEAINSKFPINLKIEFKKAFTV